MTANDEDGGEQELWSIMEAMGYNRQLKLTKVRQSTCTCTIVHFMQLHFDCISPSTFSFN